MAIFNCIYHSEILNAKTGMNVIIPEASTADARSTDELPVFTLLHGLDGNYLTWCANTRIQALAEKRRVAVVMPEAKNSFYCKEYYPHIAHELPRVVKRFFNLSDAPALNHIAGISMGGFGALKIGLLNPERYATIGSLSSVIDIQGQLLNKRGLNDHEKEVLENAFGKDPQIEGGENDIMLLARNAARVRHPRIYQFCGTEDFLYDDNRKFLNAAKGMGLDVTYSEAPGGHFWPVWAEQIWDYLPWAIGTR